MFRMFLASLLSLSALGIGYCQKESPEARRQIVDGDYVALEEMPNLSPDYPDAKWFHENTLLVRNNEAILEMVPVWILGRKKFYSASDGGFLTYRARFFQRDGEAFVNLRLFQSDYVAVPVGHDPYKEITTRRVRFGSGEIYIDGLRYRRRAVGETRRNELLRLLYGEPFETPAAQ